MKKTTSKLVGTVNTNKRNGIIAALCVVVLLLSLSACASHEIPHAPVEDVTMSTTTAAAGEKGTTATSSEFEAETTATTEDSNSADTQATSTLKATTITQKPVATTTTQQQATTTKKPTTKQPTTTKKAPSTTQRRPVVAQNADPNTGISWDGKSPIIYTYPDGSTGTKPKNGATYELVPGVEYVYINSIPTGDDYCNHCGKVMGDGQNGSCVRWMMGAVNCPNCGEHVNANTCHSCGK